MLKYYKEYEITVNNMDKIFIGWSGNEALAKELAQMIKTQMKKNVVIGGGSPKDMFIGAQVLNQINKCNMAILLVQDKEDGNISHNLMFEWGYIMAKLSFNNIHSFLINKSSRELPSDLLGTWICEIDNKEYNQKELAQEIFKTFERNVQIKSERNYFDLINDWKQVFVYITDDKPDSEQELCEYILLGCLAAYYYMDNRQLRRALNNMSGSDNINLVIFFAKAYIDVFINTENMTKPLMQEDFFRCMQDFDLVLSRNCKFSDEIELLLDILCYDAYGLACTLFLKNEGLNQETIDYCTKKAKECLEKDIELISVFEQKISGNKCLLLLLRSYIYNDIAHLYQQQYNDKEKFLSYLDLSVNERKRLHQAFCSSYPNNSFLATKLEQEYTVALSEQCNYMEDSFMKNMCKNSVLSKFKEWEKELVYTSSLTDRIKGNINKF